MRRFFLFVLLASAMAPAWCEGHLTSVGTGLDEVPVAVVKGTPYEMGYSLGELTKDHAAAMLNGFLSISQASGSPRYTDENLDAAWEAVSPYISDRFKQEMLGLADGSGISHDTIRRVHMLPVVSNYSCSSLAAWGKATKTGDLYQTRALDWEMGVGAQDHPLLVVYLPDAGVPHVNVTFAGYIGVNTGMNAEGICLSEMGDSPGGDYPFDLDGAHFTTLFRDVLYDAKSLDDAIAIIRQAKRIKKYHYVVGDGKHNKAAVKMLAHAPNLLVWKDNDPTDELAPNVLENVVYQDEGRGAFRPLQEAWGRIDEQVMIDIVKLIPIKGSNVLDVVYNGASLELWVAYAEGEVEAYKRPFVHFDLDDYLTYNAPAAATEAVSTDAPSTDGGGGSPMAGIVLAAALVVALGVVVWVIKR